MEIWKEIALVQRFTYSGGRIDRWLDFTGKGYKISSLGRLKNAEGKLLTNSKLRGGYITNNLYDCNNKMFTVQRHSLVMAAFKITDYITNSKIVHVDGNKLNNSVDNLIWVC